MSDLFNYFVKVASTAKPDAAMRRGSYAQASDRGQYRSSTIGHQGLSKRTAAQLRQTHNLPAPGKQPTGPDGGVRRGSIAQGGQRLPAALVNPAPAPKPAVPASQPATVKGAPSSKPGSLAQTFASHIPEVANWSNKDIRSAYAKGAYWDSYSGLDAKLDKSIQGNADAQLYKQLYNRMNQLGLNMYGDNSAQATAINTALQHLDALRYRDDVDKYDPLKDAISATQGVSPRATPEELELRNRRFDPSKIRPVMPRA